MEVRFKFSADIYIKGENMDEVRRKFESIPLFSEEANKECGVEFCELLLVEEAETNQDLYDEYIGSDLT